MSAKQLIDLIGNDTLRITQSEDNVTEVQSDGKLAEKCEEVVFEAVIRWLNYKEEERTPALPEVCCLSPE